MRFKVTYLIQAPYLGEETKGEEEAKTLSDACILRDLVLESFDGLLQVNIIDNANESSIWSLY